MGLGTSLVFLRLDVPQFVDLPAKPKSCASHGHVHEPLSHITTAISHNVAKLNTKSVSRVTVTWTNR